MGLSEKLAYIRFHHYGNMASLNCILNQLELRNNEKANEIGRCYFIKAMNSYQLMSNKDKNKIIKKGRKLRGLS